MPGRPSSLFLQLPKQCNKRVRSAVLHAISLAQFALTSARGQIQRRDRACDRRFAKIERLRQEIHLLKEELRLKDARMLRVPGRRRPYYQPIERLSILELRAARGWSLDQTAERMLVTANTLSSWMGRLDEDGEDALLQTPEPVNKFPEFVAYLVRRLKILCPIMGKTRIANVLCRAGLHLSATTVGRMLKDRPRWWAISKTIVPHRSVRAKEPDHIWNVDLSTIPTAMGLWCSWLPWALPQRWPYCWWISDTVDHFSRRVMGFAVYEQQPSSAAVRAFLGQAIRKARSCPRVLITDQGTQFIDDDFRSWCRRRGMKLEKHGSLSVIERLIRTIKNECTRKLIVPYDRRELRGELSLFIAWYNESRPHSGLDVRTPEEVYFNLPPACRAPRVEPTEKWPRSSHCAGPQAPVRGRRGQRLDLAVSYMAGRKHLPIVELKKAA